MKNKLTERPMRVIQKVVRPLSRLENSAQSGGANSGPPEMAEILSTTSTIPPAAGTIKAIPIMPRPKPQEDSRATRINCLSEAAGLMKPRYTSLVNTADTTFKVVFALAEVEKYIPVSIKPSSPGGNTV